MNFYFMLFETKRQKQVWLCIPFLSSKQKIVNITTAMNMKLKSEIRQQNSSSENKWNRTLKVEDEHDLL